MVSPDRPRGILSEADRKYLLSDKSGYTRQAQHKRENAIRKRVREGIVDFTLLYETLEDDEIDEIFSLEGRQHDRHALLDGIRDAIALFFLATDDNAEPFDFDTRLEGGVERAYERKYERHDIVDVELEIEEKPISHWVEIYFRLANGEYSSLSEGEMRMMFRLMYECDLPVLDLVGAAAIDKYGEPEGGFRDGEDEGLDLAQPEEYFIDTNEE